ncbi:MAG: Kazal-type serine protease inhibitor [Candidatus Magasanikbacteria bacterium]
MKKIILSIGIMNLLLLLGVGCSSGRTPSAVETVPPVTTTTQEVIIRKPPSTDPVDEALDLCEAQGYTIVFRFDEIKKSNDIYCAFSETSGCHILDFYTGRCNVSTTISFSTGTEELENLRTCGPSEHPVCGADGHTYINVCIANIQKIEIIHDGACSPEETEQLLAVGTQAPIVKEGFPTTISSGEPRSSGAGSAAGTVTTANTLWLNTLANLLSQTENTSIEKCAFGEKIHYYQEEGCPNCFSTLYNDSGAVICFPHNNLDNSCPNYFNKDYRSACTQIWKN